MREGVRGELTSDGGSCAGCKVLLVCLSRVAHVHVDVHQPWQTHRAVGRDAVNVGLHRRGAMDTVQGLEGGGGGGGGESVLPYLHNISIFPVLEPDSTLDQLKEHRVPFLVLALG